jgi:hypothetical protein
LFSTVGNKIQKAMKTIKLSLVVILISTLTHSVAAIGYPANLSAGKKTSRPIKKTETANTLKQTLANKAVSVLENRQASFVKTVSTNLFSF